MTGEAYVVYSNDCSAQNGVGSCSVFKKMLKEICLLLEYSQKKEKPFLTQLNAPFKYFQHQHTNTAHQIYILKNITFAISDSTAHNLKVMEFCEDEGVENNTLVLLCNTHPLMMFQRKIKEFCQELVIGKNRIKECFLVDIDFHSESFVIKSIKCLSNFYL